MPPTSFLISKVGQGLGLVKGWGKRRSAIPVDTRDVGDGLPESPACLLVLLRDRPTLGGVPRPSAVEDSEVRGIP